MIDIIMKLLTSAFMLMKQNKYYEYLLVYLLNKSLTFANDDMLCLHMILLLLLLTPILLTVILLLIIIMIFIIIVIIIIIILICFYLPWPIRKWSDQNSSQLPVFIALIKFWYFTKSPSCLQYILFNHLNTVSSLYFLGKSTLSFWFWGEAYFFCLFPLCLKRTFCFHLLSNLFMIFSVYFIIIIILLAQVYT